MSSNQGKSRYHTTSQGVIEVEKQDKKESFDFIRHTHNNPSQKRVQALVVMNYRDFRSVTAGEEIEAREARDILSHQVNEHSSTQILVEPIGYDSSWKKKLAILQFNFIQVSSTKEW